MGNMRLQIMHTQKKTLFNGHLLTQRKMGAYKPGRRPLPYIKSSDPLILSLLMFINAEEAEVEWLYEDLQALC